LPAALNALPENPDVRLGLPLYPPILSSGLDLKPIASFEIYHSGGPLFAEVFEGELNEVTTYFIDGPPISASEQIYTADNHLDGSKFTFFSLACLELCKIIDWKPDILHAHDWHASPAVYKLRINHQRDDFFKGTKSVLTVHNLPYLGHGAEKALQAFGLPQAHLSPLPDWAEGLPLPLGILSADIINTVSPGYAEEMLTPEFGGGLEDYLKTRKDDLKGILNGLDQENWDPGKDNHLPVNYSSQSLTDRKKNKTALIKELGLELDPDVPLLAMINRMDHQKGVDLVPDALRLITDLDWGAVILGTGDPQLEDAAARLDEEFPQVRSVLKYDGALSRRIYGGSDLILIPSRYEPCGLTQMIGMRYGCVPLARATGGLKDTIIDYREDPKKSTGFLFNNPTSAELAETIREALDIFPDKRRWNGLQRRGMKKDFSWNKAAREYLTLYKNALDLD
jgi:starch synthase